MFAIQMVTELTAVLLKGDESHGLLVHILCLCGTDLTNRLYLYNIVFLFFHLAYHVNVYR